ncbi:MAG: ATP-binding protein, partial [Myxococcota bacterium]|nr:ATP-binding protein [Myxococcota bacterium]
SNFSNVPRPLVQIVESMLVTDPAGRATSAGQVYEELCGFIYGNNLPRSDARALSVFVQELRKDEQQLFPEDMSQEVGFDEISMSELQVPEAAQSLYGDLDPSAPPPPPPSGSMPPIPPPLSPTSEATSDELPRQKIAKLMQADEAASGSYQLPGPLEEYFRATRAGRGKAVILYGQLGMGREYLPDRLQDVLGLRGNTLTSTVQCIRDDQYRPFGVLGDAIVRSLEQYLDPSMPPHQATLAYMQSLGLPAETLQELEEVWGFGPGLRAGVEVKRAHLVRFCSVAVSELCKRHTPVFIFDRVELMDALSLDVLRDLLSTIGALPTMVILATQRVEHMRLALDTGNPEHLGAARVVGKDPPKLSEIGNLDEDSRATLGALATIQYPLEQGTLVRLLNIPSDRLLNALKGLVSRGIVRVPKTGHFMPGIPDLTLWLGENFTQQERQRIAVDLARVVHHQQPQELPIQALPLRARLQAMSHERRPFLALIDEHVDKLRRGGFYHIAIGFYRHANELLTAETLGLPAARLEYMLSRAELALELSMEEE